MKLMEFIIVNRGTIGQLAWIQTVSTTGINHKFWIVKSYAEKIKRV